jgi:hypothetical protein
MSTTNDKQTSEQLILTAGTDSVVADKIRVALIHKFDFMWFYLYGDNSITVTTAFGNKVPVEQLNEMIYFIQNMLDTMPDDLASSTDVTAQADATKTGGAPVSDEESVASEATEKPVPTQIF